jgi:hypothetical protein
VGQIPHKLSLNSAAEIDSIYAPMGKRFKIFSEGTKRDNNLTIDVPPFASIIL